MWDRPLNDNDRSYAISYVLTYEVLLLLLEYHLREDVAVHDVGERLLEPLLVHPALVSVNSISKSVDRLRVARVPLHGHLDLAGFPRGFEVDDAALDGLLALRQVLHEVREAARRPEELLHRGVLALIGERDLDAAHEECLLLQALDQHLTLEIDRIGE